jgi:hypothetical protein
VWDVRGNRNEFWNDDRTWEWTVRGGGIGKTDALISSRDLYKLLGECPCVATETYITITYNSITHLYISYHDKCSSCNAKALI